MIKKLYISHQFFDWNKSNFSNLALLNRKNLKFYQSSPNRYDLRTSLADLSLKLEEMESFINSVEEIYLIDISLESLALLDNNYNNWNFMRLVTEVKSQTYMFDKNLCKSHHIPRTNNKTLYIAGCSISHGSGIKDHERYGEILAEKLGLPCIFLAMPGSSIAWQSDRILQADIRSNDIVVWGLTNLARVNIADTTDWRGYPIANYTTSLDKSQRYFNLDYFESWTLYMSCIKQILQVENVCQKIGVDLCLANLLDTTVVPLLFRQQSNYVDCLEKWKPDHGVVTFDYIDLGNDNIHPGPGQHRVYADKIYQNITSRVLNSSSTKHN
jgi:hypothetical protein